MFTYDEYLALFPTEDNGCDERFFTADGLGCVTYVLSCSHCVLTIMLLDSWISCVIPYEVIRDLFTFKVTLRNAIKQSKLGDDRPGARFNSMGSNGADLNIEDALEAFDKMKRESNELYNWGHPREA